MAVQVEAQDRLFHLPAAVVVVVVVVVVGVLVAVVIVVVGDRCIGRRGVLVYFFVMKTCRFVSTKRSLLCCSGKNAFWYPGPRKTHAFYDALAALLN